LLVANVERERLLVQRPGPGVGGAGDQGVLTVPNPAGIQRVAPAVAAVVVVTEPDPVVPPEPDAGGVAGGVQAEGDPATDGRPIARALEAEPRRGDVEGERLLVQ